MFWKSFYVFAGLFLLNTTGYSQKDFMVFGSIKPELFTINNYNQDSTVSAIVLGEYSYIRFNQCLDLMMDYHIRILIINKEGFEKADRKFILYKNQEFKNFKAVTHNMVNGVMVSSELSSDNVFDQNTHINYVTKSFTFPDVKEGSIIEYKFNIGLGHFLNLEPIYFQTDIPSIRNDLYITVPKCFTYAIKTLGFQDIKTTENSIVGDFCNSNEQLTTHYFRSDSLPALKHEPFSNNIENYLSGVECQLKSIKIPQMYSYIYPVSFTQYKKELLVHEDFGYRYVNTLFTNEIIKKLKLDSLSTKEKIEKIYAFVQKEMTWNNNYHMCSYYPLRNAYNEKRGSSAEINLLLCAILNDANIKAYPMVLSSRDSKITNTYSSNFENFDYVIVYAKDNEETILLDATSKYLPSNNLPFRCLNGQGLVVANGQDKWIPLLQNEKYDKTVYIKYNLDETLKLQGSLNLIYKNLSAVEEQEKLLQEGSSKNYNDYVRKQIPSIDIKKIEITQDSILTSPFKVTVDFDATKTLTIVENEIIISPFIFNEFEKNPFYSNNRQMPIDYGCPFEKTYIINMKIPKGYSVSSIPAIQSVELPNNAGSFSFKSMEQNGTIQIISKISITNYLFFPQDQFLLKEFYNYIISSHNENIVLKKNI